MPPKIMLVFAYAHRNPHHNRIVQRMSPNPAGEQKILRASTVR
jgi:hypothetical protein